jgi:chromosome partitioning protein
VKPSFGESIINYDATSKGAANYLHLAQEVIEKQQIILWQKNKR